MRAFGASAEGVAVRVLVFGAQAPAVLGKLRSSVLARRHAPATPESTGTARGAAPQVEHEDAEENESADDRRLKKGKLVASVVDVVLVVDVRLRRPIAASSRPRHGSFPALAARLRRAAARPRAVPRARPRPGATRARE